MTRTLKILHVESGMNLYGGALQVHYLLKGLMEHAETRSVLVCPAGSAVAEACRDLVQTLHCVPMKGDLDALFIRRLTAIIGREDPDIVHLHSRRGADILGGIAAKLARKTVVLTRRVDNPEHPLWVRFKYRLYDRIITISEGIREVLVGEGVPVGKISCVPSAVDPSFYHVPCDRAWFREEFGIGENERACGVVAQFIRRKGHRYLLEAVPEIAGEHPEFRLLLFGKGPLEEDLRSLCRRTGIEDRMTFAGFREDLPRFIGCLDLLIHPALKEGLGVSLLQAAAAGVPIVGTRAGGIPEIVQDGVNGYLVPAQDPVSLAGAVKRVLADGSLARQLGENGRSIVAKHFSIRSMVEGNLAVYREIMERQF